MEFENPEFDYSLTMLELLKHNRMSSKVALIYFDEDSGQPCIYLVKDKSDSSMLPGGKVEEKDYLFAINKLREFSMGPPSFRDILATALRRELKEELLLEGFFFYELLLNAVSSPICVVHWLAGYEVLPYRFSKFAADDSLSLELPFLGHDFINGCIIEQKDRDRFGINDSEMGQGFWVPIEEALQREDIMELPNVAASLAFIFESLSDQDSTFYSYGLNKTFVEINALDQTWDRNAGRKRTLE